MQRFKTAVSIVLILVVALLMDYYLVKSVFWALHTLGGRIHNAGIVMYTESTANGILAMVVLPVVMALYVSILNYRKLKARRDTTEASLIETNRNLSEAVKNLSEAVKKWNGGR